MVGAAGAGHARSGILSLNRYAACFSEVTAAEMAALAGIVGSLTGPAVGI